jgi:hypothetical protein
VQTFDETTISFALTLQTAATRRRGGIYAFNHYLRRWGLRPTPFGRSAVRDFFKHQCFCLYNGLKWCLGRKRPAHAH